MEGGWEWSPAQTQEPGRRLFLPPTTVQWGCRNNFNGLCWLAEQTISWPRGRGWAEKSSRGATGTPEQSRAGAGDEGSGALSTVEVVGFPNVAEVKWDGERKYLNKRKETKTPSVNSQIKPSKRQLSLIETSLKVFEKVPDCRLQNPIYPKLRVRQDKENISTEDISRARFVVNSHSQNLKWRFQSQNSKFSWYLTTNVLLSFKQF